MVATVQAGGRKKHFDKTFFLGPSLLALASDKWINCSLCTLRRFFSQINAINTQQTERKGIIRSTKLVTPSVFIGEILVLSVSPTYVTTYRGIAFSGKQIKEKR